jgi:hypothetical protein
MDLEGNIAKFNGDELHAMGYCYPEEVHIDTIDPDLMLASVAEREAEQARLRLERDRVERVRQARWIQPTANQDGVTVGETTEEAFRLASDKAMVTGIVEQIHAYRMGVSLEPPTRGTPND